MIALPTWQLKGKKSNMAAKSANFTIYSMKSLFKSTFKSGFGLKWIITDVIHVNQDPYTFLATYCRNLGCTYLTLFIYTFQDQCNLRDFILCTDNMESLFHWPTLIHFVKSHCVQNQQFLTLDKPQKMADVQKGADVMLKAAVFRETSIHSKCSSK